jgi:hypothetical protein
MDATASAQLDIGLNNTIIQEQKDSADLATQNARLMIGAITGTDMNQQGEVLTGLVDTLNGAYKQKAQLLQGMQEKQSVGFMDNPLQHILNQFTINDDIRQYNAADNIERETKAHIDELNEIANTSAKNQANFTQSITQASIDANAKNTLDAAQVAANKSTVDGLGYNIQGLTEAIQATREKMALQFQALGAQNAQEHLRLAMDTYALHKQEFDWNREEKLHAKEGDEFFIDRMQQGLKVMYGANAPDLTASPKVARQYLMLLRLNSPAGKEASEAYMAGQSGVLGGSPSQVIDTLQNNIKLSFTPAQQGIKTLFDITYQEVSDNQVIPKDQKVTVLNQTINKKVSAMLKDIEPGSSNLFNIGATSELLSLPAVFDTKLAQEVLVPAVAAGAKLNSGADVFAAALAGVNSKKLTIDEASQGITALYQKGVLTNLATKDLPKFGIVPTESMKSYNTKIQLTPDVILGGTAIVDLTKPADVSRALNTALARGRTNPFIFN